MYASHIITGAGSGGIICFNDKKLYEFAKLLEDGVDPQLFSMNLEGITNVLTKKLMNLTMENTYFLKWVIIFCRLKFQLRLQ